MSIGEGLAGRIHPVQGDCYFF